MDFLKTVKEMIGQTKITTPAPTPTTQAKEGAQPTQQPGEPVLGTQTYSEPTNVSPIDFSSSFSSQDESIYTQQDDTPVMNGFENTQGLSKEEINEKDLAWREEKKAMGLKTTNINYDRGETTFAEYFAALDPEVKEMLTSYFEEGAVNKAEAEKAINEIAGIFQNTNVVKTQQFVNAVRALGYDVEWGSVKTDYIIDWKNQKAGGGSLREGGNLTMLTIKNKAGEELFKMVDANGNGYIEMEELFFNEFLTGISSQIDKELMVAGLKAFQSVANDIDFSSEFTSEQGENTENDSNASGENGKTAINISKLKQLVESKTKAGKTVEQATVEIKASYNIDEEGEKFLKEYKAKNEDSEEAVALKKNEEEAEVAQEAEATLELEENDDELLEYKAA